MLKIKFMLFNGKYDHAILTDGLADNCLSVRNDGSILFKEDLTWTTHIQTQVKKARQRLYHLRQLRKFRVSPSILKTFYSGTI